MPRIAGTAAATRRLTQTVPHAAVEAVGRALYVAGDMVRVEAGRLITENATSGKNHVPSAPGMAPNEDTGFLRANIETIQAAPLRVEVSSNAPYSAPLEFGTSKMAARPFMGPALRNKRDEVRQVINKAVSAALRSK